MSELTIKDIHDNLNSFLPTEHLKYVMQLIDSAITEARLEAATMGARFGNAAFRQQSIAEPGKPINLDAVLKSGVQQARDWAKRTP